MKLTWENLCKIKHVPYHSEKQPGGGLATYEGVPGHKLIRYYVEIDDFYCDYCGLEYIKEKGKKNNYCDAECRHAHTIWKKEWNKRAKKLKRFITPPPPPKPKKVSLSERPQCNWSGPDHPCWKGGGRALYDLWHEKLDWCLETRPNEDGLLEVRCAMCDGWKLPTTKILRRFLDTVEGKNPRKKSWVLYCSEDCAKACRKLRADITHKWKVAHNIKTTNRYKQDKIEFKMQALMLEQKKQRKKEAKAKARAEAEKAKAEKRHFVKLRRFQKKVALHYRKKTREYKNMLCKDTKEYRERLKKEDPKEFKLRKLYYYTTPRSKEKNISRTITLDWLRKKCDSDICSVTGKTFDHDPNYHRNPYGPSIDRLDKAGGYDPDNCRIVIWGFNRARAHFTDHDVYEMCKSLLKFKKII